MRSRATVAWAAYLVPAAGLGLYALAQWISALANRSPVLYGEGAVANAGRLATLEAGTSAGEAWLASLGSLPHS